MKQNDIVLLIGACFVGIIASVIASKYIFSTPNNLSQSVDVVPTITTNFQPPSPKYFNAQSIDPTPTTNISQNNNRTIF